jgi:hypothetical protein
MIKNNTEPIEFNKINNYTYLKTISINMPFINKKTETSYVAFGTYFNGINFDQSSQKTLTQ